MDARTIKEKATEAFTKGKFSKAAELYDEYCRADPKDLQARLRMGDAWAKGGQPKKAISAYQSAAEGFARDGFLPRAIAASKLILELDPLHQGVQQMLADLYAKRSSDTKPALRPPPVSARSELAHGPQGIDLPEDAFPDEGIELSLELPNREDRVPERTPLDAPIELTSRSDPEEGLALASEIEPLSLDQARPVELPPELNEREPIAALLGDDDAAFLEPGAPPGLKPKRVADPPPPSGKPALEVVVELTHKKDPDPAVASAPRIWIPGSFVAPPLPPPGSVQRLVAPGPTAAVSLAPEPSRKSQSELEASLAVFSQFDALADEAAPVNHSVNVPTFTELELEGDSLLHAVEMAARAGIHQRTGETSPDQSHVEERVTTAEDGSPESINPGALPKIPLFSDLAPQAFIELFERCPLRRFGQSERIIEQGSLGDAFYVICAGTVRVVREDKGVRKDLAVLTDGAFFGEMALLSGAPRTASVESASEDTQVLEISAPVLAQLSHRYPGVATALKKFCRQRLLANLIGTSEMFAPLSKKERKTVVERFRARDLARNDIAVREGDLSPGLFVVLSGEMQVRRGRTPIATLKEGDVFGEMSLVTKGPASATVLATKRTSLLRLPREEFDSLITRHPQIGDHVARLSDQRQSMNASAQRASAAGEMLV